MPDLSKSLREELQGRYDLDREIGQGATAVVFLAHDLRHHRAVAVKLLRPELTQLLGTERFHREIRIAAQLHHPHILPLYDSGEASDDAGGPPHLLYYMMPYIEGESLRARLQREGPLPLPDALRITRDIAEALAYAHGLGIIHRDIKPENILFTDGAAILADFGVARAILEAGGDELTSAGMAVGTPAYMSPEQGAGETGLDGRADLYSLGCVLYEMLAGEPPFTGATVHAVIRRHQLDPVPPIRTVRPTVPAGIADLVRDLLAKVPADRPATAAEVIRRLDESAEVGAESPTRYRRWLAGGAATAVMAAALWFGGRLVRHRSAAAPTLDPHHVAVLYFRAAGGDSTLPALAAGITEDLISSLADVPALQVTSAEGVRRLRGTLPPLDSVGRMFDAGTIVSGTVTAAADTVRVVYEMTDPVSKLQLTHGQIERPLSHFFDLQAELASGIAAALRQELGREIVLRESRSRAHDVTAWERVQSAQLLRENARSLAGAGDYDGADRLLARADTLFASAQRLDPQWSDPGLGRALVAFYQAAVAQYRTPPRPADAARDLRRGLDLIEAVLARHSDDPRALALRGQLRYAEWANGPTADPDTVAATQRDLEAAVDADPQLAMAWYDLSRLYLYTGRFSEAETAASRALASDAWLTEARHIVSQLYFTALNNGSNAEAWRWCTEGRKRFRDDINFSDCGLRTLGWFGKGQDDVRMAERELDSLEAAAAGEPPAPPDRERQSGLPAERRLLYAAVLARSGAHDSARRIVERTRGWASTHLDPAAAEYLRYPAAWVYDLVGDEDSTLALLHRYLSDHPALGSYVAESPWFTGLHDQPRFRELVGGPADR